MPKKTNPSLKNAAGYYQSQYDTSNEFNKNNYDTLTIRIPKGQKDNVKEYVAQMQHEHPNDPRYQSVNLFVKSLIQDATGIDLS